MNATDLAAEMPSDWVGWRILVRLIARVYSLDPILARYGREARDGAGAGGNRHSGNPIRMSFERPDQRAAWRCQARPERSQPRGRGLSNLSQESLNVG